MPNQTTLSRLFFGMATILMLAAGFAMPRTVTAQEQLIADVVAPDRCPGRTLPVCREYTQGGQTDYYYFP
jgi:hypothetical protein